tara:strand:+ start:505 stop:753 length:249 start_codon:yes stop_codon:yes gene_type:complete
MGLVEKLVVEKVLKLLLKQFKLNKLLDYMEKPNPADIGVAELKERVSKLEEISHEPREFVTCADCDKPIKDYKKHLKYKGKK